MEEGNPAPARPKPASSYGLKHSVLSPNETLAQSVALIAPTAAPLLTVPLVYASAGAGSWLAFVISTITILFVALNINVFARISASPGSLYTYISDHMHPVLGILAGWAILIAYIGTAIAIGAGLTNYAKVLVRTVTGVDIPLWILSVVCISLASLLAYQDVQISARLMLGLEAISVSLISFISLSLLFQHRFAPDTTQLTLQGVTPENLRRGLVLAIFCLVGFESATSLGHEARDPLRSIPRAVKWSAILAGLFFVFCAYSEVFGFRGESPSLDKSLAPMQVLARKAHLPMAIGLVIDFGAIVSFFSCLLACITAAARVLFLMGRNGSVHGRLGEAHKANQTPHRAVVVSSIATLLPVAVMTSIGIGPLDVYGLTGTLATFGFLTAYLLVSIAAPRYLKHLDLLSWRAAAISILAIVALAAALFGSLYPVPEPPYSYLPYVYLSVLAIGFLWSLSLKSRSPVQANELYDDLDAVSE